MPKFYPSISDDLKTWLLSQPVFFIASAPLAGAHINVSPKGLPSQSLAVLGPNQVAYLDATGSGCETISHIYENGRVTLMACSFGRVPRIMRLFCTGRVIEKGAQADFDAWLTRTGIKHGVDACRAVIVLDVFKVSKVWSMAIGPQSRGQKHKSARAVRQDHQWIGSTDRSTFYDQRKSREPLFFFIAVQTSCGYGVPVVNTSSTSRSPPRPSSPTNATNTTTSANADDPEAQSQSEPPHPHDAFMDRPTLNSFARKLAAKDPNATLDYQVLNNVRSLDGCPGLRTARAAKGEWVGLGESKARARRVVGAQWEGVLVGLIVAVLAVALLSWLGWVRVEVVA